jgi:hypothetical protein
MLAMVGTSVLRATWNVQPLFSFFVIAPLASILLVVSNLRQCPTVAEYGAGFCGKCGYNLTGLTSERCPECGEALRDKDRRDPRMPGDA